MSIELAFLISVLVVSAPLLLAGLGELVAERAGVLNIGLEGLMLIGCFAAFCGTVLTGSPYLGVAIAALAGAAAAAFLAWFVVTLQVEAVVAGTALNLLAIGGTATLYQLFFGVSGAATLVEPLPDLLLPLVGLALAAWVAYLLFRTRIGLQIRACGEGPAAARAVGVPVARVRFAALVLSGAFAGLAGAHLALVQARTFVEGMTAGRGFLALAVVVCARWSPLGAVGAALLFGAATALQVQVQASGGGVPYQLLLALPYGLTLAVLAVMSGRSRAPAGLGRW